MRGEVHEQCLLDRVWKFDTRRGNDDPTQHYFSETRLRDIGLLDKRPAAVSDEQKQ